MRALGACSAGCGLKTGIGVLAQRRTHDAGGDAEHAPQSPPALCLYHNDPFFTKFRDVEHFAENHQRTDIVHTALLADVAFCSVATVPDALTTQLCSTRGALGGRCVRSGGSKRDEKQLKALAP
ncbi:hypothetical protein FA95DRAFT_1076096 [Auriscalpium vulgare]|uniref:Uncharacterized protein n=1 Tax=Auriscalpium vulgare TaxID=40419 RepID=A0ACB8RXZ0_9AGAM|nr:hypothetical protein FA95DRAFT_1076096 [Auriscalpium vulgare]